MKEHQLWKLDSLFYRLKDTYHKMHIILLAQALPGSSGPSTQASGPTSGPALGPAGPASGPGWMGNIGNHHKMFHLSFRMNPRLRLKDWRTEWGYTLVTSSNTRCADSEWKDRGYFATFFLLDLGTCIPYWTEWVELRKPISSVCKVMDIGSKL